MYKPFLQCLWPESLGVSDEASDESGDQSNPKEVFSVLPELRAAFEEPQRKAAEPKRRKISDFFEPEKRKE